jgi:hypothetical protein
MKRFGFLGAVAVFGWTSTAAQAQNLDALKACARLSNESTRLACYDGAVVALDAALAGEIAARKKEAEVRLAEERKLAEAKAAQAKLDSFGANNLPPGRQPETRVESPKDLKAKIDVVSYDPYKNLVALLDNGQTWIQTESLTLPKVKENDEVEIKRGALGGYRMTILRMNRSFSVQRKR